MEAKAAVIMGVLILGMVVAEIEAKSCCKTLLGRHCYKACRFPGTPEPTCDRMCDCLTITGSECPADRPKMMLEGGSGTARDYCMLGCESSVCDNITKGLNFGAGEGEVNQAVEHCNNACSELCNKVELLASA